MRRLLPVAALAALLAGSPGCAESKPRSFTPAEVYDAAVAAGTARITVVVSADEVAPGVDVDSTSTGVADLRAGTASVHVAFSGYAFRLPGFDSVTTRERVYLRTEGPSVTFRPPSGERGIVAVPTLPLARLRDVREWELVGDEKVEGHAARHYSGRATDNAQRVDAWVGDDGRPFRIDLAGDPKLHLAFRLDLRDYGTAAAVTVPSGAREVKDQDAAFGAVGLV